MVDNVGIFLTDIYTALRDFVQFEKTLSKWGDNIDLNKYICYPVPHAALKERLLKLRKEVH